MKQVSIQQLKNQLSALIEAASRGQTIVVTKHGRPVVQIAGVDTRGLHVGKYAHLPAKLLPPLKLDTKGEALRILLEDRRSEP